jgi:hypothetical protein
MLFIFFAESTSTYISIYDSTTLLFDLGRLFSFLILYTIGRTPWTGDQPVATPLTAHRMAQTQKKHTDIHASSRNRIHDPSVRASEDSSCLRPRGHCDLPKLVYPMENYVRHLKTKVINLYETKKKYRPT